MDTLIEQSEVEFMEESVAWHKGQVEWFREMLKDEESELARAERNLLDAQAEAVEE